MPKIVQYRSKCIGCGVCFEMQPEIWRMSKRDGKATMVRAELKGKTFVLQVEKNIWNNTRAVAEACPVKIIKLM